MAKKVANPGGPQFTSRALRPGGGDTPAAGSKKKFDLGTVKGAPKPPMMKPFKGNPRGR